MKQGNSDPVAQLRGHKVSVSSVCLLHGSESADNQKLIPFSNIVHSNLSACCESTQLLASCDVDGTAFIWNISTRRIVKQFGFEGNPAGLGLRVIDCCNDAQQQNRFLYHTRGTRGLVSVLGIENLPPFSSQPSCTPVSVKSIFEVATMSRTFCTASSCIGDSNLIVTPSNDECIAHLYDIRQKTPILRLHGAGRPGSGARNHNSQLPEHGMITSLAMCLSEGKLIVACGMESGDLYFHDCRFPKSGQKNLFGEPTQYSDTLRQDAAEDKKASPFQPSKGVSLLGQALSQHNIDDVIMKHDRGNATIIPEDPKYARIKLSSEPILALDLNPSASTDENTFVAICGCAGDAASSTLKRSPDKTGAIVKASFATTPVAKLRQRFQTCELGESSAGGKPGISCCRFRNDGRVFAVGGWDHRARIISRKGKMLAILKGHEATVTSVDWSPVASSGLLATGSSDGRIYLWRLFFQDRFNQQD